MSEVTCRQQIRR